MEMGENDVVTRLIRGGTEVATEARNVLRRGRKLILSYTLRYGYIYQASWTSLESKLKIGSKLGHLHL